ncbi:integrase [Fontibacillus solani]|uniref:Integrase n=1 Tax=Fontibacillus solani TaxID=1572857 RepID=A0A7W3SYV7_9BACL|nr:site-specific integrase [Fontibacillus solani]MBA9088705.1 integrase [Fontibacillus solani]
MARRKKLPSGVRKKNGRYTYRYDVYVIENGKSRRKQKETPSFSTPEEAYETGVLIKAQQITGTYVDEKNLTFSEWSDKWVEIYSNLGRSDNTIKTKASKLNVLKKEFGGFKLKDITSLQYQEYLFRLKKEGKKKNTLLGMHSAMRSVVKAAANQPYKIIANDFTEGIVFPEYKETLIELKSKKNKKVNYLEKEELSLFIKTAYELPDCHEYAETEKDSLVLRQYARVLHILAFTGLRIGELCSLEKEDIDYENKQINVIKNLYYQDGIESFTLGPPKNETSIREVDMTNKVVQLFKDQEFELKKLKLMLGLDVIYKNHDFIFINGVRKPGYPLSPLAVNAYMKNVLEKAELPKSLTPHKLRHTYTSLSAEAGIDLSSIQRQLGHADDEITKTIYLHVTKAKRKSDIEKLEELMSSVE